MYKHGYHIYLPPATSTAVWPARAMLAAYETDGKRSLIGWTSARASEAPALDSQSIWGENRIGAPEDKSKKENIIEEGFNKTKMVQIEQV